MQATTNEDNVVYQNTSAEAATLHSMTQLFTFENQKPQLLYTRTGVASVATGDNAVGSHAAVSQIHIRSCYTRSVAV